MARMPDNMALHADCVLCCCFLTLILQGAVPSTEGATQNFAISGLDSLSPNRLFLMAYGGMQAYVAYMPDSFSLDSQRPSAWLLFIPSSNSSTSFILASLVFPQASQNEMGAIVWMANRHHPVSRNFFLSLNQTSGNLILLDGDGSLAWSSNVTSAPNGTVSMDLITDPSGPNVPIGTLILSDSANRTLWRSSDHPTHALAPSQFLQPGMSLVSWASASDPSDGLYRLVMEAGGIAIYRDGSPDSPRPYWLWSYYGRNDSFGISHTCKNLAQAFMDPEGGLLLGLTDETPQQESISLDLCVDADSNGSLEEAQFANYGAMGNDDITVLSLQYDGNLLAHSIGSPWTTVYDLFSDNKCLLPDFCGPYGICSAPSNCKCPFSSDGSFPSTFPSNHAQGCPPTRALSCMESNMALNPAGQQFLRFEGVDYFPNKYTAPLNLTSLDACQNLCLQHCPCLAVFWHEHSKSCFHAGHFVSSLQGSLNSSYITFLKVEAVAEHSNSNQGRFVIGLVSGAVALAILILTALVAALVMYYRKVYRAEDDADEEDALWSHVPGWPKRFSYKELQSITNDFSEQMGRGGFGAVYAGALQDGTKVAVKRLESLRQGTKEFRAEVVILGGVHHYNLVELVGYCAEGSTHRLLVYEYMANGSLDQWLFTAKDQQIPLPWGHRFNIALGAARGLAYLHGGCKDTVVHLDIKPQNILLDNNFVAKVSDFGLSTLMGRDETQVITRMRGTPGYLAPEMLAEGSEISPKCDVFSYGKLLMELLGARRNLEPSFVDEQEKLYFPAWLYLHMTHQGGAQEADLKHIAGVETSEEMVQAKMMMKTAFLCVLENPSQRPCMETVVHMLEGRITMLEQLNLSDLFQGLHFALSMPSRNLANDRIDKVLAFIFESSASLSEEAKLGLISQGGAGQPFSLNVSAR